MLHTLHSLPTTATPPLCPCCRDYVPSGPGWRASDLAAPDPTSLHGGCPVLEGTKLIATRWIRSAEFH